MEKIIEILIKRDGISRLEAQNILQDCIIAFKQAIQNQESIEDLEDIVYYYLGLEPDYLEILLNEVI